MKKLHQATFRGEGWQLVTDSECWAYVVFVHRTDKGGQFISYRQLQQWRNAVACQIQNCSTWQQLRTLWLAIENDFKKHKQQYDDEVYPFLSKIWTKCWDKLWHEQESSDSLVTKTRGNLTEELS